MRQFYTLYLKSRLALIFSTGGFKYSYFDDFGTAVIACYEFCFETVKCSAACKCHKRHCCDYTYQLLKMCVFHRFLLCIQNDYTIFAAKGKGLKFILNSAYSIRTSPKWLRFSSGHLRVSISSPKCLAVANTSIPQASMDGIARSGCLQPAGSQL